MKTRDNFQYIGPARYHQAFPVLPEPSKPPTAYYNLKPVASILRPSAHSLRSTLNARRSTLNAFTLIEVLVAMTVLSVMVLMVANIFQSSSAAWNIGTQKADMNTSARAALDYMARELASAVAGPVEAASLVTPANISFELSSGNDVKFVALSGDPGNGRALRGVNFKRESMSLQYERFTNDFNPYTGTWIGGSGFQPLITNVLSLSMVAFANESALLAGGAGSPYGTANTNDLPLCVDIALEMLSDDDMQRYNQLSGDPSARTNFVARNAKLYSTRVYFPNRKGYQAR